MNEWMTSERRDALRCQRSPEFPSCDRQNSLRSMAWSEQDLRTALERLAAPPVRQLEWLRELGTLPSLDELALDFDDEFGRVRGTVDGAALAALDEQLSRMSGPENAGLWRPEALEGPEWSAVRELAARGLRELDG